MGELFKYFIDVIEYIPTNLINIAVISYLFWFSKTHTKEHKDIMEKVSKNEEWIERLEKDDWHNKQLMLKGLITNDNLPNFVRMDFYKEYKKLGGNSWVDAYVKDNIQFATRMYGRRYDDQDDYIFDPNKENGHTYYRKEREEPEN